VTSVRADAWTDDELTLLYEFVNDEDWLDEACELLPNRTRNAIQQRMSGLRREAEIVPRKRGPRAWSEKMDRRKKAAEGSRKLALALLALDEAGAAALSEHERGEADTLRHVKDELEGAHREQVQLTFLDGPLFDWRHAA
jgi:hypothetical protein